MRKALAEDSEKVKALPKVGVKESLRKQLSKGNACFVLITCANPKEDGKMQVEMTYEGDVDLAAMLIETAQGFIHQDDS